MKQIKLLYVAMLLVVCQFSDGEVQAQERTKEAYRPQFHFSPKKGWMNDPNGMVYLNGKYHLFFQHSPNTTIWGPMHWGHAISTDLVHWQEQPIALYPDSLGTIFSGSAVVDKNNTAGFGQNAIVAIFTHHNKTIEDAKTGLHQYQSLAYSNDEGKTWTKYKGNPVLPNPGIWDFRDPKVMWHESSNQWIMTLATKQSITFYGSKNLKDWNRLSEFGEGLGAHGGVWECPDLFSLSVNGIKKWVLLVSINPGAPSGGSGTQYFIGQFDGKTFTAEHTDTRWIDYGADNYAGITWSNTGDRKIFIGWMNNWTYANLIPEQGFRGAATIARDLKLKKVGDDFYLASVPVKELSVITGKANQLNSVKVNKNYDLSAKIAPFEGKYQLELTTAERASFSLHLSNSKGDELIIGYDKVSNTFYTDRTKSGQVNFESSFARKTIAPRIAKGNQISLKLLLDATSSEVFADEGLATLTNTFFSSAPLSRLHIKSSKPFMVQKIKYSGMK
ncbi:glycoside hydrolase family 32 protein [Pedobacter nyackensis]|uniref:Fructan beta-fructosidase n=1 Tax=Pedobacter nyackensis TaxID=475255 RepID=A0A1W2F2K4_9SPHI|nr:glycoside hydrolase family 32 protein [Pedobacter nyackensis]SMD16151.1 fructan beta-fructosidase [Pedobacter nyackensis]